MKLSRVALFLSFLAISVFSSCSQENRFVVGEQIVNLQKACEFNDGLEAISISSGGHMAKCGNHSFLKQPKTKEDDVGFSSLTSITNQEIQQCQKLCEMNQKIKEMAVDYHCTSGGRRCDAYGVEVSCVCENSITQIYSRVEKL